jgi:hypothetical protein
LWFFSGKLVRNCRNCDEAVYSLFYIWNIASALL